MAAMNVNIKDLTASLLGILQKVRKYVFIIIVLLVISAYAFLLWRINTLADQNPSEDAVTAKLRGLTLPKIDQNAITKIQQLQDHSVQVQALFQQARDNPFQE